MNLLSLLAIELGIQRSDVVSISKTAPFRYKTYRIRKRSGGSRVIAQPTPAVKAVQRAVTTILSEYWACHPAATAYVKQGGIKKNALRHIGSSHLLKMDFSNFFNSINPHDFKRFASDNPIQIVDASDVDILIGLLFWAKDESSGLCLSVGAPSSPFISNVMMRTFDHDVAAFCQDRSIAYSRYADDLTFSGKSFEDLNAARDFVKEWVANCYFKSLKLNDDKTLFVSKKYQRRVTGLVITNNGSVSLGRDRKRLVRAQVHRFSVGKMGTEETIKLAGMLAFINDVEPSYLETLERVFGGEIIREIQSTVR